MLFDKQLNYNTGAVQVHLISRMPKAFNHIKISLILFEKFPYLPGFQIGFEIWQWYNFGVKKMPFFFVGTT